MATDEVIEEIATAFRNSNEPDVDIHEGGYFDMVSDSIQIIEEAGYKVVKDEG